MPNYVDIPSQSRSYLVSLPGRVFGPVLEPSTWLSFAYLLLSVVTGTAYFTIAVTGISVAAGLAVLIVGVPFALGFLGLVRLLSVAEGRLVELFLGAPIPRRLPVAPKETGLKARALFWLKDRHTWTGLLYMIVQGPLGVLYFTLVVAGLWLSTWLVTAPIAQPIFGWWRMPLGAGRHLVFEPWAYPLLFLGGVALFIVTVHGVRSIARSHAAYAKAMLLS